MLYAIRFRGSYANALPGIEPDSCYQVYMDNFQSLNQTFEEHTLIWLLISAFFGGVIGALIKFISEFFLVTRYQEHWKDKQVIAEISYSLLQCIN